MLAPGKKNKHKHTQSTHNLLLGLELSPALLSHMLPACVQIVCLWFFLFVFFKWDGFGL